jgi:hypothetical protein
MAGAVRKRHKTGNAAPWGRLCLGVFGGYGVTTLLLAAFAALLGPPRGEAVNWMLILAPLVAASFCAYAFAARSLFGAARNMAVIGLTSCGVILGWRLAA